MAEQKNRINNYKCANGHTVVTKNIDEGTTPMFITCPTCEEQMRSMFYMVDQSTTPTHEWYKPTKEQCKTDALDFAKKNNLDPKNVVAGFLQHLDMGGLFLMPVKQ